MNSKDLANEICNQLFKLSYRSGSGNYTYDLSVISKENQATVLNTVQAIINDNYVQRVAELEAKVFVYEEMIKKSNFAPMLQNSTDE